MRVLLATGAAIVAALLLTAASAIAGPRAYVAQGSYPAGAGHAIAVFDVATGAELATIDLPGPPTAIAINPAGTVAYASTTTGIKVIDLKTNTVVTTIPGVGGDIAFDPSGDRAYTTNDTTNKVVVIDTATNTVTKSIAVGTQPRAVVANAAGTRAYTGSTYMSPYSISTVDLTTDTDSGETTSSNLARPENLGILPTGAKVYAANFGASAGGTTVGVFDTTANTVSPITVGTTPDSVAANPAGTTVYVANRDSSSLSVIDVATSTNVGTVALGLAPTDIAIAPDGKRAVITDNLNGKVAIFDLQTAKVVVGPFDLVDAGQVAIQPAETPLPSFTASAGLSKEPIALDASTSSGGPIVRYDWSFGDGAAAPDAGPKVSHAFAAAGSYEVKLTATNGCDPAAVFGPLGVAFAGQTAFCKGPRTASKTLTVDIPKAAVGVLLSNKAKVGGDGVARLRLACVKELACAGTITLQTASKIKVGHGKKKRVKLATKHFKALPAGAKRTIRVQLSHAALSILRARKKLTVTATASVTNPSASPRVRSRNVTLTFVGK
ncbi:MAG: hypothetical protein QOK25_1973 [Thermoleophilaceae bacterium]|nr:hypothetical protein [Thermoleophilaceae bacterium]